MNDDDDGAARRRRRGAICVAQDALRAGGFGELADELADPEFVMAAVRSAIRRPVGQHDHPQPPYGQVESVDYTVIRTPHQLAEVVRSTLSLAFSTPMGPRIAEALERLEAMDHAEAQRTMFASLAAELPAAPLESVEGTLRLLVQQHGLTTIAIDQRTGRQMGVLLD